MPPKAKSKIHGGSGPSAPMDYKEIRWRDTAKSLWIEYVLKRHRRKVSKNAEHGLFPGCNQELWQSSNQYWAKYEQTEIGFK